MEPSKKSSAIEESMKSMFGFDRRRHIQANECIPPPIGCGQKVVPEVGIEEGFRTMRDLKEYTISGLCQNCQDKVFSHKED